MNEKELIEMCNRNKAYTGKSIKLYWTSELYSFGKYIRKYGYFPGILPLAVYSDHSAPSFYYHLQKHELETDAPVFLSHSKFKVEEYKRLTGNKSYIMYSPAVFYRKKNNIKQSQNANGTVAFPVHSLPSMDDKFCINEYCIQLKKLPEKYQPIKICLHMHDINRKDYVIYQKNGFEVITAGNTSDYRFIQRFYKIISNAKYVTSNDIGTVTLYALEMGVPFFVYGKRSISINKYDKNFPIGERTTPDHPLYSKLYNFLIMDDKFKFNRITDSLYKEIEEFLGVKDGIGRMRMSLVLWYSLFSWLFSLRSINYLKKINSLLSDK